MVVVIRTSRCKANKIDWWATSPDFRCWIETEGDLDPYTLAHDYFTKGKVRDFLRLSRRQLSDR